jgi:membrane fusion protein (multidrug efflux system)
MKPVIAVAFAAFFACAPASCSRGEARKEGNRQDRAPAPADAPKTAEARTVNVKVERIAPTSLTEHVVARGVTRPVRKVTYSAEIAGRLEYLSADLGDRIRQGQTLARIDFQTLKAQADQAEAQYQLAQTTQQRLDTLKGEDLISQQQIDEARSNLVSARSALAIARANLDKSTVRSSYRGIVSRKYVERAEFVGPGTRLYDVIDYRTIIVEAQLAESEVATVTVGATVEVDIDALDKRFEGKVDTIIPTADAVSKTFTLRVEIDNPELEILVGMSAVVRIAARQYDDVLAVPQGAVLEGREGRTVFVAEGETARERRVRLGARQADRVVLLQGVSAGESLVVMGQRDLVDGQNIRIVP